MTNQINQQTATETSNKSDKKKKGFEVDPEFLKKCKEDYEREKTKHMSPWQKQEWKKQRDEKEVEDLIDKIFVKDD